MSISYASTLGVIQNVSGYTKIRDVASLQSQNLAENTILKVFTSSTTFTLPSGIIGAVNFVLIGGGGPGGGVGGGGGGGAGSVRNTGVSNICGHPLCGATLTVTIGAGGVPATATVPATCGGATSICISAVAGGTFSCAVGGGHAGAGSACSCTSYPLGCWNVRLPPGYCGSVGGSGGGGSFGGNLGFCAPSTIYPGGSKGYGQGRSNCGGHGAVYQCSNNLPAGKYFIIILGGGGGGGNGCGHAAARCYAVQSPTLVTGGCGSAWTIFLNGAGCQPGPCGSGGIGVCGGLNPYSENCLGVPSVIANEVSKYGVNGRFAGGGAGGGRNINCSCSPVPCQPTAACITTGGVPVGVKYVVQAQTTQQPPNCSNGQLYGGGIPKPVYLATCFAGNSYPGVANTGGGGGGALMIGCGPNCIQGGAGGSGVVLMWYQLPTPG